MITHAIAGQRIDDPAKVGRYAETAAGITTEVVSRCIVIAARLLAQLSETTGKSEDELLQSVDPGDSLTVFGHSGWSTEP
jgi:hypothetical protein